MVVDSSIVRYSKLLIIQMPITSNITTVRIRRDLKAFINQQTQYEICYGNRFHVNPAGKNIKSTGFKIAGETATVYITDTPNEDLKTGSLALVKETVADVGGSQQTVTTVVVKDAGTVDYVLGEININTVTITSTDQPMDIIEIQAFPESNDVIGLKDLYLSFNIDKSEINMVKDVIASGDDISGVVFSTNEYYRSSYSNGELKRHKI